MLWVLKTFMQFFSRPNVTLLLARHGTGNHLEPPYFNVKKDGDVGPSLTGKFVNGEWTGGKGEAFRRIVRQLREKKLAPTLIICSCQMRAIETAAYARRNTLPLSNGKCLKDVPIKILRGNVSPHEQTRCLEGQGKIVPSLRNASKRWPSWSIIGKDKPLLKEIQRKLSLTPRQPPNDPRGSALTRASKILDYIYSWKHHNKIILLIAHNGICQDLIRSQTGKKTPIFDLCEVRNMKDYESKM